MAGMGVGATLASLGQSQMQQATQDLGQAANEENKRNMENKQIKAAAKQGNQSLGATVGALGGFALGAQAGAGGGPYGALIGGVIGAVAGGMID